MIKPDLGDFGFQDTAQHPSLWDGCLFSCCPALGYTGTVLPNHGPQGGDLGTTTPNWSVVSGMVGVKSGSYSAKSIKFSSYDYLTCCITCQLTKIYDILLESSINFNDNTGAFLIYLDFDSLAASIRRPGNYNLCILHKDYFGGFSSSIHSFCLTLKGVVSFGELCVKLMVMDGIDRTSNVTFGGSLSYSTTGFIDYPIFLGARNKTISPSDGNIFDCAIYGRPFTVAEAIRYTTNPLERYQRRRRFALKTHRFAPALATTSNIILPAGVSPC